MTANAVRLMLERRRTAARVHVSAHAFRRGAAAEMLRAGVSQMSTSVERICGWAPGSPMVAKYTRSVGDGLAIEEFRKRFG